MTQPDPARYPAGTRVLVEATVRDDGLLEVQGRRGFWTMGSDQVDLHGTVAELERLQAHAAGAEAMLTAHGYELRLICDELEIPMPEMNADPILAAIAALRIDRDTLAANNARLRQERDDARSWARHGYEVGQRTCTWSDEGVAPAWLTEGHDPAVFTSPSPWAAMDWALTNLRAEVTRIADEMHSTADVWEPTETTRARFLLAYERELRAALAAEQATQPAVVAAEPLSGAGADEAMHDGSDGSVGHDGPEADRG